MMSLRDGLDEQQAMDAEADLLSVATISSTNNILIRPEDDLCDYFIPYNDTNKSKSQIDSIVHNLNTTLFIADADDTQDEICPQVEQNKSKESTVKVKLAETEALDDSEPESQSQ
ncbi:unnamed protein product [Oppiella nova]|uniref:Uncharacterized protein n=1 Tax=Oppiella nova TaxID=334625 RepID=A0A7R9MSN0_9ACAR|nr:unnamed protein product [Oppiella nova]CAG2182584.1 unnamed protein product [Oppiella nova]